ncbi:MAG: WbqC family protein [bacterium]
MPWPGFFYKVIRADILVLLDNVQFPLGISWVNRNRIKNRSGAFWLTVPVWKKGRGKQGIKGVEICNEKNWQKKHYLSLIHAYKNAPYLSEHMDFFHELYHHHWKGLLDLNTAIIRYLLKALGIEKEIILSSSLNMTAKGQELLIQICKKLDAGCYVSLSTGRKYIDEGLFQREKIRVKFYSYRPVVYPQLWGDFKPNLSAIDFILNCGGDMALAMLGRESYGS